MIPTYSFFGVQIHSISFADALQQARVFLAGDSGRLIFTPNPEILLQARKNDAYRRVLQSADLSLPDGVGIRLASPIRHTVAGVDFASELLKIADEKQLRVACIIPPDGRSTHAQVGESVKALAPRAGVEVFEVQRIEWREWTVLKGLLQKLAEFEPQIVLAGLGFPEQEEWLEHFLKQIPSARIGMGIGGAFDFWTGVAHRAPRCMRRCGLEWLWRLLHEPRRLKRIVRAVILFPAIVFLNRFKLSCHS